MRWFPEAPPGAHSRPGGVRLAKSRGHRRAVVAVTRKLAVIPHRMWIDGSDFHGESLEVTA
jgi:transposase